MPMLFTKGTHVIFPDSTIMINGIGMKYDAGFPKELHPHMTEMDHFRTMMRINTFLRTNFPPLVNCTCAEGEHDNCQKVLNTEYLYLSLTQLLDEETTKYNNTVTWSLAKELNMLTQRMEFVIKISYDVPFFCKK